MSGAYKLSATIREEFGKGYARRIRMAGDIPAVIYGHGEEPKHVVLPGHETTLAARTPNAVFDLDIEGESVLAMVKDIQRHAIRPEIQHMDLLIVKRGERVEVEIPVHVEGEVAAGAVANTEMTALLVEADAIKQPEVIEINIEGREVGEHITAADVVMPEGVTLLTDEEAIVVNIAEPAVLDVPEPGEEGDTDAEGNPVDDADAVDGDIVPASEESDQAGEAHDSDNNKQ
ncbi:MULTISPECIES: 50S ribosomal protein L25/general stress protein Ctc [unclassified Rothia (in: high G+C Gram-positive bacteria)]|uniref:50S ribosomal protein L25/general stress protein Ctc n=1 Tax=unclassified Rothia (in: high G+C Gram-positive bacteria) TaxID=2689056 RepID=UPI00195A63FD|nr:MULTISPECIES: 50S ribosomal protein L25/general stress protein Ctc [unclassified Rothia (in: high G+C Gram-positive bacteria)]MBM7051394.1 50S ribosomal protein L25/general stress protein Ctc [Rothia sp. ZJ1223]QRZ61187.1 50S ribosomal protein L25/general stress protein Ctc [Rothia sp. ZJ932]